MLFDLNDMIGKYEEGLRNYDCPDVAIRIHENNDIWLHLSNLQKAIRLGFINYAVSSASTLFQVCPDKLWKRMSVIVLEDIGAANLNLIWQVHYAAQNRVWRERHGEWRVLSYLITAMCQSIKSREANDLICIAAYHPAYDEQREKYGCLEYEELCSILRDKSYSYPERTIAACYIRGTTSFRDAKFLKRSGHKNNLLSCYQYLMLPEFVYEPMRLALSRSGEGQAITLALAWEHLYSSEPMTKNDPASQNKDSLGGLLLQAYDIHTRAGKQAYRLFLLQNKHINDLIKSLNPNTDPAALIGHAVFAVEGRLLDQKLVGEKSKEILKQALISYLSYDGTTQEQAKQIIDIVNENMEAIQEARANVAR